MKIWLLSYAMHTENAHCLTILFHMPSLLCITTTRSTNASSSIYPFIRPMNRGQILPFGIAWLHVISSTKDDFPKHAFRYHFAKLVQYALLTWFTIWFSEPIDIARMTSNRYKNWSCHLELCWFIVCRQHQLELVVNLLTSIPMHRILQISFATVVTRRFACTSNFALVGTGNVREACVSSPQFNMASYPWLQYVSGIVALSSVCLNLRHRGFC